MNIVHTSSTEIGQIYIPQVNKRSAGRLRRRWCSASELQQLAAAYGIAVTGTMAITTILLYGRGARALELEPLEGGAARRALSGRRPRVLRRQPVKIADGGWFPLVVAVVVYLLMTTWKNGRGALRDRAGEHAAARAVPRRHRAAQAAPGARHRRLSHLGAGGAPPVLLHHLKHNKVLHERVMLLSVVDRGDSAQVPEGERMRCRDLGEGFYQVMAHYGFMETPDVPSVLQSLAVQGGMAGGHCRVEIMATSFYLGRETLIRYPAGGRPRLRGLRRPSTADRPCRHGPLAQEALHPDDPERPVGHGILRSAAQPGGGAGRADPVLVPPSSPRTSPSIGSPRPDPPASSCRQGAALGDVLEQPAHDLPAPGLGQVGGEEDVIRPGDGADLLRHVVLEVVLAARGGCVPSLSVTNAARA